MEEPDVGLERARRGVVRRDHDDQRLAIGELRAASHAAQAGVAPWTAIAVPPESARSSSGHMAGGP
jgi:hypothetical protein